MQVSTVNLYNETVFVTDLGSRIFCPTCTYFQNARSTQILASEVLIVIYDHFHDFIAEEKTSEKKKSVKDKKPLSLQERMMEKLNSARFRYINKQLYTSTGKEVKK